MFVVFRTHSKSRVSPKFHGLAQSLVHGFELIANENAVFILAAFASHHSPPGVVILPLTDAEVTWKILVVWRGRPSGALKALLEALLTKALTRTP
jgi:DNA-binding transcriptional LysR family regulator